MLRAVFVLSLIVLVYGGYFLFTGTFAFRKNKTQITKHKATTRFSVIIPARNEETVIGELLHSLNSQDYPKELYNIYVLINNCTDRTRQKALALGAEVIDCEGDMRCKGDVLKYAFEYLGKEAFDAYVVFDADNVVHPDFLSVMNNIYQSGHKVAQGRKDSKNMGDNWISASYSLFYNLQNFFYNRARTRVGASATINGTGFMVSKDIIDEGFEPRSVTEDIELSITCLLKGHRTVYTEEAVTYDEQPTDFRTAWHQRKRWSLGMMQCLVYYSGALLKRLFTKKDFSSIDKILFMVSPAMQIFAMIPTFMVLILFCGGFVKGFAINSMMLTTFAGAFFGYLLTVGLCIFTLVKYRQSIREALSGVLMFMFFMLSWVPINIFCWIRRKRGWVPVKHCRNVSLDALISRNVT